MMVWNLRSSAPSFSMCLRYSTKVVAPMHCSSPRASAGLSMLEASMAPSAAPAPTMVCSSSMNRMMSFWRSISSMITLRRSSNCPRYLVPATTLARSSVSNLLPASASEASPAIMRCASPSTMAVLPTPGSPSRTGLFFLRRLSTWMTRIISRSRPMTGSSLPSRASAVKSRENSSSVGVPVLDLAGAVPA